MSQYLNEEPPKMATEHKENDKPAKAGATEEKRLFQTGVDTHEELTKAEAEKKGFFWAEEPKLEETKK